MRPAPNSVVLAGQPTDVTDGAITAPTSGRNPLTERGARGAVVSRSRRRMQATGISPRHTLHRPTSPRRPPLSASVCLHAIGSESLGHLAEERQMQNVYNILAPQASGHARAYRRVLRVPRASLTRRQETRRVVNSHETPMGLQTNDSPLIHTDMRQF